MTRDRLIGRWRLTAYEATSPDGVAKLPMGPGAIGVLQYTADAKVSVHIMTRGAERYFAYYGDYTVDESAPSVTHLIEMSSEPTFVGASNLRYMDLEGNRLVLSGPMTLEGKPHTIKVTWEREAD